MTAVKQPTAPYNPFYGCAIMLMAAIVFGGIVSWSIYSLLKQDSEIALFTVEQPVILPTLALSVEDKAALLARAAAFGEAAKQGKAATLALSIVELNALIEAAPDTGYGNFRTMISFKATQPDTNTLLADVCLPLNKARFWEGKRYVVGEASFVLDHSAAGPDIKLTTLTVPGKVVSQGFVDAFSSWHWVTPYQKLEPIGTLLKGIKSTTVTATGVIFISAEAPHSQDKP
jgi:hypothetical protein